MRAENTTLIAIVGAILRDEMALPDNCTLERATAGHAARLADLWLAAYPPDIAAGLATTNEEIRAMFDGDCGRFWSKASPLILADHNLVAAICTVHRAPWHATPTCPFIIDLMVRKEARRRGLATFLLQETARVVRQNGHEHLALRVLVDNVQAIALYRKLGFTDWDGVLYAPE